MTNATTKTLKRAPSATERSALLAAQRAAQHAFDLYLDRSNATAASQVPDEVIDAALDAYQRAGGAREIHVWGSGNRSHPVITIRVGIARRS